ncbi:MAG TPA: ACT domain-containing protein [Syntrophales bacterium]|nr:ACT domain-containing protein [Syntrophales bacterium]HOX94609.1 ACT domain-containing protein [Syntrophales bacterium]HPI58026.1 ACT domain-containing protein [Syntrophales bacterium]HPN25242.1 ACT domain-containing protein [Syntrophales bacterium]HQM29339.1 ACT domain-containing protein [Syntrophales bacterium]
MKITQVSVFLDNRPGVLAELTEYLGAKGVNIRALSVAESRDFGVIRMIVPDPSRVAELLGKKGYNIRKVEVLAVRVTDEPGGLGKALRVLADEVLNVDYLYTFLDKLGGEAVVILRVDNLDFAKAVLKNKGFSLLSQDDFQRL